MSALGYIPYPVLKRRREADKQELSNKVMKPITVEEIQELLAHPAVQSAIPTENGSAGDFIPRPTMEEIRARLAADKPSPSLRNIRENINNSKKAPTHFMSLEEFRVILESDQLRKVEIEEVQNPPKVTEPEKVVEAENPATKKVKRVKRVLPREPENLGKGAWAFYVWRFILVTFFDKFLPMIVMAVYAQFKLVLDRFYPNSPRFFSSWINWGKWWVDLMVNILTYFMGTGTGLRIQTALGKFWKRYGQLISEVTLRIASTELQKFLFFHLFLKNATCALSHTSIEDVVVTFNRRDLVNITTITYEPMTPTIAIYYMAYLVWAMHALVIYDNRLEWFFWGWLVVYPMFGFFNLIGDLTNLPCNHNNIQLVVRTSFFKWVIMGY